MEDSNSELLPWELSFLLGHERPCSDESLLSFILDGRFSEVINHDKVKSCFSPFVGEKSELEEWLHGQISNSLAREDLFAFGTACLLSFIQANWTHPLYDADLKCIGLPWLSDCLSGLDQPVLVIRDCLIVDGEEICPATYYPELLLLAKISLQHSYEHVTSGAWWLLRCLYIHQQVLDEHSSTLQSKLLELSESVKSCNWVRSNHDLSVLLHLEVARIHLHYGKINISDEEIAAALSLLGLEVSLAGAMGKRTQYQIRELPQLTVKLKVRQNNRIVGDLPTFEFPNDITLNDDVRLPKIAFSNSKDCDYPQLTCLEQAAVLSIFAQKKKSQAKDKLLKEELLPYLHCLLSQPRVWSLHYAVLLFRSRLESDHRRTIERSLLQMQALMDINKLSTKPMDRLQLFFITYLPPHFVIGADCASILLSLGSIQSALDIYLRLEMWEEVIACYNHQKLRHKAAEVIREQMQKGETVKLLCYLGDATDETSCYERAWELSNKKSAQAQRHWAMFYFNRQMYAESIPHLKASLQINSLQVSMWFRLGYAALMEHDWEESASAYRRYCSLEPDSFEAWNNLAKAYILLGQKHRAYSALHEAIKCNYDTWQVWDNLMAVSSDCADFEGVINCYHRILDLKEKHIDEQILSVLTSVIIKGIKDFKGNPASVHKKKALELFGRITCKVMGNATVWQLYARLTASLEDQSPITKSKTAQYLQKAHTAAIQDYNWCKEFDSVRNVVKLCQSLAEAYSVCKRHCTSPKEALQLLTSAQMSLRSILTKIQMEHTDVSTGMVHKEILEEFTQLQSTYDSLQADIQQIRNTLNS